MGGPGFVILLLTGCRHLRGSNCPPPPRRPPPAPPPPPPPRALAARGADAHADDRVLGDRRVADALLAELLEQPVGDLEGAVEHPDVLAHQVDLLVALHLLAERLVERLAVADDGHQVSSVSAASASSSSACALSEDLSSPRSSRWACSTASP